MKKTTVTAAFTAICSVSIAASLVAPAFAQPTGTTTTTPTGTTPTTPATTPAIKSAPSTNTTTPAATPATKTAPAGASTQSPSVEELKLSKDQQTKLAKLNQDVMKKKIAVLTKTQKDQVQQAMQKGQSPTLTLTAAQQEQLKAIQIAALKQQDDILTKEQRDKLKEMNKQNTTQPQR